MWDAQIDDPFGRPTRMPLYVEDLFVHSVLGPRKWLVRPESKMARLLGTKMMGCCFVCNFSLIFSSQPFSAGFISI